MPVSFAQRRAREADVEAAIGQHDDEDDDFSKFMEEIEQVKKFNTELKRTIRDLRARLRAEQLETIKWRHRCMALAGRFRLPRGRGVIRSGRAYRVQPRFIRTELFSHLSVSDI